MTRMLAYGDRAWLLDGAADPVALAEHLRRWPWPSAAQAEVVAGAASCLLRFHGPPPEADRIRTAVDAAAPLQGRREAGAITITLPVRYDGQDLASVAQAAGCSVDAVIAMHTEATFRVSFLGFLPGFAYLDGLPEPLRLPRRDAPRVRVPAGSVAIADRYSAVYPTSSPGGWHVIGSTATVLFDAGRSEPCLLRPGMTVRFEAVA